MIDVGDYGDITKLFYHGKNLTNGYELNTTNKKSGDYIGNSRVVRTFICNLYALSWAFTLKLHKKTAGQPGKPTSGLSIYKLNSYTQRIKVASVYGLL